MNYITASEARIMAHHYDGILSTIMANITEAAQVHGANYIYYSENHCPKAFWEALHNVLVVDKLSELGYKINTEDSKTVYIYW